MNTLHQYLKEKRGRARDLANALGLYEGTISQWREKKVPAERVLAVEEKTGLSRHDLRPDIFGPSPKKRRAA